MKFSTVILYIIKFVFRTLSMERDPFSAKNQTL